MKILTLQNNDRTPSGLIGEAIAEAGGAEDVRFPDHGDAVPADASGHDGLLVLGGGQFAGDDAAHPYLPAELAAIRAFAAAGKPVLGICLGAQLLARALGGTVRRHHTPEVGFTAIEATEAAASDPLLCGLAPLPKLMHWHYDTFDLPPGATLLATNAVCPNQAFSAGPGVYGLQFHLEVTADIVQGWVDATSDWVPRELPDFFAAYRTQLAEHCPASARFARQVGLCWMEMVRAARAESQRAA
ncbi:type 1 glutamine amidotransferase [Inquilinus sp. NPDC058860]|uniref:type 1 glutamine amidotransferase n=1 Tax=Inquilinus sp. NPDC058860 TaxID=3346652 RepID=UPI003682E3D9